MNRKLDSVLVRFVEEAKRFPMLSPEREQELARAWRDQRDRAALEHLENGSGFGGIAEVDRHLPADVVVAGDRMTGPPLLDALRASGELCDVLGRGVDREAMEDV